MITQISFYPDMIDAIDRRKKTHTRRPLRKQPIDVVKGKRGTWTTLNTVNPNHGSIIVCRYGAVGDHLKIDGTDTELVITKIRVERIQSIKRHAIMAEGSPVSKPEEAREWFINLWNSIYSERGLGWDANPWVWDIGFVKI